MMTANDAESTRAINKKKQKQKHDRNEPYKNIPLTEKRCYLITYLNTSNIIHEHY